MSKIVLITGANKGLGFEAARRLAQLGHTVLVGSRDADRGRKAAADVTAAEGRLDVLINNAGIAGPQTQATELAAGDAVQVFETNVIGIVRTTGAFLPLLRAGTDPAVVNVSSGLGSQALTHDPNRIESSVVAPLYNASKAAVTMMTVQYAKAFPGIRFNAVDPGYTATDLNGHSGPQTVTEGTDAIVTCATEEPGAGTGRYLDRFGPLPW